MTNEQLARLFARVIVADILAERVDQPAAKVLVMQPKKVARPKLRMAKESLRSKAAVSQEA